MWKYEYKQDVEVDQKELWKLYENVKKWKVWDDSIVSVDLDGKFETGTTGAIHNTDETITPFELKDVKKGKSYTLHTRIPEFDLDVDFGHLISPRDIGVFTITHSLVINGNMARQIGSQIGPELTKDFEKAVDSVIKAAKGKKV